MRVKLTHPQYQVLARTDEALILQGDTVVTLFPDAVEECTVTLSQDMIHAAALSKHNTILHWHGSGSAPFQFQEIDTEKLPVKGLKLVADSAGTPHLFYLQQGAKQSSWSLMQHSFIAGEWSDPLRVTGNITSDPGSWQVCFGADQSLHLVYLSQTHDTLFYRAADMKARSWTGAVPIAQEYVEHPQVFAAGFGLVVFWISQLEQGKVLRAVVQMGTWSKPSDLSPIAKDIFQPGIEFDQGRLRIMWMQSGKLWYTSYDQQWAPAGQLDLDQRQFGYQTVLSDQENNLGCCVLRMYSEKHPAAEADTKPQHLSAEETKPPEHPVQEAAPPPEPAAAARHQEPSSAEQARREAERRFFAEAFQLRLEWQSFKEQYAKTMEDKGSIAETAEKLELLSQRVLAIREEVRSLKAQAGFNQHAGLEALQRRVEQLEAGLRGKAAASELQEVKNRVVRLEQQTADRPVAVHTKPEKPVAEQAKPEKKAKRTIWQQLFSRL
ncbi:MAG: hypothetical protein WBK74_03365 [Limnochordia bacterium]